LTIQGCRRWQVVTKLDRLGRSTRELLDLIDRIGKAGASFRSTLGHVIGARPPAIVMRKIMIAILPAVLDALVVQHLAVMIEADPPASCQQIRRF
jgi:hypothetical protein